MSDHIPFEIQSEIMNRLPVKSLIQFRSVSKQWKSLIDSAEFIKSYHINHANPQHHLFATYNSDTDKHYTSITDNTTFPQQKFSLTVPESLSLLSYTSTLSSVDGLLCFCGFYGDVDSKTQMRTKIMAVIWNPTIRKSVGIVIPRASNMNTIVGFGVCPDTSDPKLVKISSSYKIPSMWEVNVFTLSTRVWKTVYMGGAPFKWCNLSWPQVFVDGVIYFRPCVDLTLAIEFRFNSVISFELKSEKFGEVRVPDKLVHAHYVTVAKVNESLGLLEYYYEGETIVCGVWSRNDGANKPFTKIYTVEVEGEGLFRKVLGFRNNSEAVLELDDDKYEESRIEVYEPLSGHANSVGINGTQGTFSVLSYMETLLLLESDSIIH